MTESSEEPRAEEPKTAPRPNPGGESLGLGVTTFRRVALALGFGVIAVALFGLLLVIYFPVLRPLLWAAALATLFFPLHRKVYRLVRGRERTAAVISTALTIAIFAVPVTLLVTSFASEARNLWPAIRDHLGSQTFARLAAWLDNSWLRPLVVRVLPETAQPGPAGIEEALSRTVSGLGDFAMSQLQQIGRSAPGNLLGVGVTILIYFFFLRHGPGWIDQLERALPLEREHAAHLLRIAGQTINAVFRGVIITAAFQATLAGVGFAVAGAPVPVMLSALTLIAALIPFVGPVAIWLPVGVGLVVSGRTGAGIGLMLWGMLVVSLVDNFLRPYLIGRETRLPVLWLFLSILGGIKLFGLLGLLLGPAVLSLFLACFRIYTEGRRA